ncbi:MAG TPA: PorV/PorQ family protein, partial [Spirochaetota bacterium]|nr:PorV/PorQ family protein [Spirochaetota bacterium]
MKYIKTIIFIIFTMIFLCGGLSTGITADGAIIINPSARAMALGESYGSLANDVQALHFNPAGLALINFPEISTSYLEFIEGVRYINLGYAHVLGKLGVIAGEAGIMLSGGLSEVVDYTETGEILKASEMLFQIGYALMPVKNLFVGFSTRFYNQRHFNESGFSINFNAGVLYSFQFLSIAQYQRRNVGIGVSVQNAGMPIKIASGKSKLPFNIKTGLFYKPRSILALAFDFNYMLELGPHYNLGMEIMPDWYVSPRIGYKFGIKGNESFTCGLGINVRKEPIKIRADYALLPMFDLGSQHYITLTFNYNVKKTWEELEDEKLRKEYEKKQAEKKKAELVEKRKAMLSGTAIAVAELQPKNVDKMEASMVGDALRSALVKSKKFRVIDKANMNKIIEEQAMQSSGIMSTKNAVEIGKMLG